MKILRTDQELQTPLVDAALLEAGHELVLLPDGVDEERLISEIRDTDLLLMCYTPITRRVIEAAPKLRGIVKYGVGIDAIDIPAAVEHGVTVVNIPEYAEETVAEGAFALLIALTKKLPALNNQMHREGWAWPEPQWLGSDIAGKTLGIIGLGKIGRSMARMAGQGFRARVIAYSPHTPEEEMRAIGVEKCDTLDALLTESDFVSVHSVLNNETHRMIGERELKLMKSSAILINAARGAIIDEEAMVCAMREGWIAGLGLDVFSQEPLSLTGHPMSELFDLPNVILSPHLTFYTHDAMERLEQETLERCQELLDGRDVLVKSADPRLRVQTKGVVFDE
ncbi:C-terminal binding protein [Aliiroseovarius sp. KMU-50]|uniref:C-terminal binding protein n=1 Tax=Aliiroseovarius salicola TaxID=3009082 RepID=A0ABT4W417_9RHOB|nr:C-terminal binding protein [Aliiroseovarius sp. KMU-50]MDA5095273.1 C-terminal binding protein [Aliiroseovarius sp. KMU-50]